MHPPWLVLLQLWILSSPTESSVKVTSISSDRTVTFSTLSQAYHFRSKVLVSLDLQTTAAKQSKTMVGSFLSMTPVWLKYLTENTLSGLHFHESELDVLQSRLPNFLLQRSPASRTHSRRCWQPSRRRSRISANEIRHRRSHA